jgi:hypothetical protein
VIPAILPWLRSVFAIAAFAALAWFAPSPAAAQQHSFRAADGQFLLDGKPFRIISGEMHYARASPVPTGAIVCAWPEPWA